MPVSSASDSSNHSSSSTSTAFALLPSWPHLPRQSYAVEAVSSHRRPQSSRLTPSSPRLAAFERQAPYPSTRPLRHEMLDTMSQSYSLASHERDLYFSRSDQQLRASPQQSYVPPRSGGSSQTSHANASASGPNSQTNREAQHKVYLLNCKHCGNFLSDRGMKAVLLLKPNITLYSTDIVPTTCGPYFGPSSFHGGMDSTEPAVERTCECLTQSLGCYGCGAQVGYNIISPCIRCTNSVMKHQRSSNGHRTVLHCSEISVRERRYVPGEPGVRAAAPTFILPPSRRPTRTQTEAQVSQRGRYTQGELFRHSNASHRDLYLLNGPQTIPEFSVYEEDDLEAEKSEASLALQYQHLQQQQQQQQQHTMTNSLHDQPAPIAGTSRPSDSTKKPRVLKRGDLVYWSDLVAGGERAQPFDPDPVLERPTAGR